MKFKLRPKVGGTVSSFSFSFSFGWGFFFVSVLFGLFILRPFLRATLPAAKSNLQKFFHQKSAVSINILKIAGTAIAKHIDRTLAHRHTHTHTYAGRQEAIAAPGRFLGCLFAWLAALSSCSVWFMNACADICHVSAWSRANPPLSYLPLFRSFSAHPPPSSVVLLAPKIMLQYFCSACALLAHPLAQQTKG